MKPLHILLFAILTLSVSCKKEDVKSVNGSATGNNRQVGSSANELLSAAIYTGLAVEVLYMPGYLPDQNALNNMQAFVSSVCNKPLGISISMRQIPASGKTSLSVDDVKNIENTNRTKFNEGSTLAVSIIYADAPATQTNVLGSAYKNTSMVVFAKTIKNNSGGLNQTPRTKLETTVLTHEFGHLFGLVDLGSAMQTNHVDVAHDKHCINQTCLMYYASETNQMAGILVSAPVPSLDANCKNDLIANGGKP